LLLFLYSTSLWLMSGTVVFYDTDSISLFYSMVPVIQSNLSNLSRLLLKLPTKQCHELVICISSRDLMYNVLYLFLEHQKKIKFVFNFIIE